MSSYFLLNQQSFNVNSFCVTTFHLHRTNTSKIQYYYRCGNESKIHQGKVKGGQKIKENAMKEDNMLGFVQFRPMKNSRQSSTNCPATGRPFILFSFLLGARILHNHHLALTYSVLHLSLPLTRV